MHSASSRRRFMCAKQAGSRDRPIGFGIGVGRQLVSVRQHDLPTSDLTDHDALVVPANRRGQVIQQFRIGRQLRRWCRNCRWCGRCRHPISQCHARLAMTRAGSGFSGIGEPLAQAAAGRSGQRGWPAVVRATITCRKPRGPGLPSVCDAAANVDARVGDLFRSRTDSIVSRCGPSASTFFSSASSFLIWSLVGGLGFADSAAAALRASDRERSWRLPSEAGTRRRRARTAPRRRSRGRWPLHWTRRRTPGRSSRNCAGPSEMKCPSIGGDLPFIHGDRFSPSALKTVTCTLLARLVAGGVGKAHLVLARLGHLRHERQRPGLVRGRRRR